MNDKSPSKRDLLTAEEQILLAEYAEIGPSWRNDVDTAWRFYALIIPTCLAALYVVAQNLDQAAIVFAVGGSAVLSIWFGFLFYRRQGHRNQIRWNRAHEIERDLGMNHHLEIHRMSTSGALGGIALRELLRTFAIVYTVLWAILALATID